LCGVESQERIEALNGGFMILSLIFSVAMAQTANIKDIPVDGDTTISVSNGAKNIGPDFEITKHEDAIEGEPEVLTKEARSSWKKACAEWKKETKENNKESQVMALSCNSPSCGKADSTTTATICKSTATYQLKTKIKE
jgi:hypothetical protein